MPRRFTPREANEELREIRPLVEGVVEHQRELRRLQAEHEALARRIAGNGAGAGLAKLEEAERRERVEIIRRVNEVHERGAIVKDLDTGLVDFPARIHGEEVLLCWRLGEEQVEHWHGLEEGFAGRKLLDPE